MVLFSKIKIILFVLLAFSPILSNTYVYLVHGFMGHRFNMVYLEKGLEKEGYQVINWSYHSVRDSLPEIARQLETELQQYSREDTIHFVTHSMGGLVVRSFFHFANYENVPAHLGRLVMIAPPNQGAEIANFASRLNYNQWLFGENVEYMRTDKISLADSLAIPPIEFGIIAAARGAESGYNLFIDGANDGYISLPRTYLEGAQDYMVLSNIHFFIVYQKETLENVICFLKYGRFNSSG